MAYHEADIRGAKKDVDSKTVYLESIKDIWFQRLFDQGRRFFESVFLFLPLYFVIRWISIFIGKKGRLMEAWLLRRYLQHYFYRKGIRKIFLTSPVEIPPGSLILTTRIIPPFAPLYYYQLFTTPVIVPVSDVLYRWWGAGKLIKRVSYPDGPMTQQKELITGLLKQGYRVIVHLNPDYLDPMIHTTLYLDPTIKTLMSVAKNTYFLKGSDLELYSAASSHTRVLVIVSCKESGFLIDSEDPLSQKNQGKIADFFQCRYSEVAT